MIRVRFCDFFSSAAYLFFVIVSGSSFYILHMKCSKGLQTTVFSIKFSQSPFMVIPRKDFATAESARTGQLPPSQEGPKKGLGLEHDSERNATANI